MKGKELTSAYANLKKKYKKKIELYEYYSSGWKYRAAGDVQAVNVRVTKDKVFADVKFIDYNEGGMVERHNGVEYDRKRLDNVGMKK